VSTPTPLMVGTLLHRASHVKARQSATWPAMAGLLTCAVCCLLLSLAAALSRVQGRTAASTQTGGTRSPAKPARWTSAKLAVLMRSSC